MPRMLGSSHYWNSWYCPWREGDGRRRQSWPKGVQSAFKRRHRSRERREFRHQVYEETG